MYELTFTYSIGSTNLVARAIKISDVSYAVEKIQKVLGTKSINIISCDVYNSSDAVYFDRLIDCEKI